MTASRTLLRLLQPTLRPVVFVALVFAAAPGWPATAVAPPAAAASAVAAPADERSRIAAERAAAEARFNRRGQECRQRFIVTSCLDDAKAERRQTLDRLRVRQLAVDEARRHERAEQRKAELAEKAVEDARRERARAAHASASAASGASPPTGVPIEKGRGHAAKAAASGPQRAPGGTGKAPAGTGIKPRPQESKAAREQHEAASRAGFETRQSEAAAHRDEAIERATKRMAKKSPAAQLPLPGPASTAASSAPRP